jgi:uncharacterized membrane protein
MSLTSHGPANGTQGRLTRIFATDRYGHRVERFVRTRLIWNRLYRAISYLRSALWIAPLVALLLVVASAPLIHHLDAWLGWRVADLGRSGAQALYNTVITLSLSFLVFTFGSLLVAIQVAGGQLTPRIIATILLRDNVVRTSVGLFVFSLIFSVMALNRLEKSVPELVASIVAVLGIACMAMFLFLIDYAARLLRPVTMLSRVGDSGLSVVESVYPEPHSTVPHAGADRAPGLGSPTRIVPHTGKSMIVLAVDLDSLLAEAIRADGVIEFIPQVGDFVAGGEPLFALYGGAAAIEDERLSATVAFGPERTLEQDPMFALRIMADIALKALSPAINDPTTAVLAIDQIHRFLREVGERELRDEVVFDGQGGMRLVYRTPDWEDFVHVACCEIRGCGAGNMQIARRMRAMLDKLCASLPASRHHALLEERERLDLAVRERYRIPSDLALARQPDTQGLGGSSGARGAHAPRHPEERLAGDERRVAAQPGAGSAGRTLPEGAKP